MRIGSPVLQLCLFAQSFQVYFEGEERNICLGTEMSTNHSAKT